MFPVPFYLEESTPDQCCHFLKGTPAKLEDAIFPEMTMPEILFTFYTIPHFLFYMPQKGKEKNTKFQRGKEAPKGKSLILRQHRRKSQYSIHVRKRTQNKK